MSDPASLLSREINVWAPMVPDMPYLAQIKGLGFSFYAPTAMRAKRAAETWRQAEYQKLTTKAQRAEKETAA